MTVWSWSNNILVPHVIINPIFSSWSFSGAGESGKSTIVKQMKWVGFFFIYIWFCKLPKRLIWPVFSAIFTILKKNRPQSCSTDRTRSDWSYIYIYIRERRVWWLYVIDPRARSPPPEKKLGARRIKSSNQTFASFHTFPQLPTRDTHKLPYSITHTAQLKYQ